MTRRILSLATAAAAAWMALPLAQEPAGLTANSLKGLEFRSIGPTLTTGRIQDIEIDPRNPSVWYIASAFGGLWKTENRGISFSPIFDSGGAFTADLSGADYGNYLTATATDGAGDTSEFSLNFIVAAPATLLLTED